MTTSCEIQAGGRAVNGVRTGTHATKSLTLADAMAIKSQIPLIKNVAPNVDASIQVIYGNQNWFTTYRGVSPEFFDIKRWPATEGALKSTLMNILGCLDRPSFGRYLLDGVDVSTLDKRTLAGIRNRKLGFVFQGFNLLARTTASENTELPTLFTRLDKVSATHGPRQHWHWWGWRTAPCTSHHRCRAASNNAWRSHAP